MRRFLHLMLAAFLALAVPLQGLAGVTMASCGGAHAAAAGGGHGHDAMDPGAGHADHAAMDHAGHDMSHETGNDATDHNCAACAACCSLTLLPAAAIAATLPDRPSSQPIPFFGSAHASVQARGLERPPSPTFLG